MPISPEQLGKIRGVSLDELRVRLRQRFAILSDRLLLGRPTEISDDELFGEFNPVLRGECAADALRHCLRAKSRRFLPSLEQRREIVEVMNRRSPTNATPSSILRKPLLRECSPCSATSP